MEKGRFDLVYQKNVEDIKPKIIETCIMQIRIYSNPFLKFSAHISADNANKQFLIFFC
jgi:hypothetical protein